MAHLDYIRFVSSNFHRAVDPSVKLHVLKLLARYEKNRTKEKLIEIIMNIPIGLFLSESEINFSERLPDADKIYELLINGKLLKGIKNEQKF